MAKRKNLIVLGIIILALAVGFLLSKKAVIGLPKDWQTRADNKCSVKFTFPPPKDPYLGKDGESWQLEEFKPTISDLKNLSRVIYGNSETKASHPTLGVIEVWCGENAKGEDSTKFAERIIKDPSKYITAEGQMVEARGLGGARYWGRNVIKAHFSGGIFDNDDVFLLTTKSHVYLVRMTSDSPDAKIKDYTQKIFSNIQFID